jgi:2-oxoglutarate dehydrogenase E1 component
MDKFSYLSNAHTAYIDGLYETYLKEPTQLDPSWQKFFEGFDFARQYGNGEVSKSAPSPSAAPTGTSGQTDKEFAVAALIEAYRNRGHLLANTNPVRKRKDRKPLLDLADFGLTEADKSQVFSAAALFNMPGGATLGQLLDKLQRTFQGKIGFEFAYVRDPQQKSWLLNKIENEWPAFNPTQEVKKRILTKLNEAVVFENFLHTKYVGQKRFSLEGGETTIPVLDFLINTGANLGSEEFVIGMAHRGRLNVLANTMGKTYEQIFSEFEGSAIPDLTMGDGDVKYHLGYSSDQVTKTGKQVHLKLCPNPSHLEAVNPTVIGFVRARMAMEYGQDARKITPILIHGDAAHAGQGVVYEVTQMARLNGYNVGGTIHLVINNQVGFTTDFDDARSSAYCTDLAKIIEAPVFHVNGDDPEAAVFAANLAAEFRQTFGSDAFIDLVCYRRHGHNESDEPKFTQPSLYNIIARHLNPREIYKKDLIERGDVDAALAEKMDKEFRDMLQERLNMVKQTPLPYTQQKLDKAWEALRKSKPEDFHQSPSTGVPLETLQKVGKALVRIPEGFKPVKQIEKLLKEREEMIFQTEQVNWATAELLAYGSILAEKKVVRISGQDVQRGTFSHRHAVLRDSISNLPYNSLNFIEEGQETFSIYNSLLSEYAVLGFEFGYSMANPDALTIWEAQFGDFANGAQVMIDQFLSSSESKWNRMNGIVLLLPHGYEGQGPEHSNARPERFLQLAAEYNMTVANITSPANFFHALRRQLAWPFRKPLVIMSPKSLLRHPKVVSSLSSLTSGSFQEVYGDENVKAKDVKRVLLCSGKVYFDLLEKQQAEKIKDTAIVRMEQLFPFPEKQLGAVLAQYSKANLFWVQEEPENMGAWSYILRHMRKTNIEVIGRKESASPAVGYLKVHNKEQIRIVEAAFSA